MTLPFDLKRFAELQGQGGGQLLQNIGSSFGVPGCMMDLGAKALSFLTANALTSVSDEVKKARQAAENKVKAWKNKILFEMGFLKNEDGSGDEPWTVDALNNFHWANQAGLDGIGGWLAKADGYLNYAGELYANVVATYEEIEKIKECIDQFKDMIDAGGGGGLFYGQHRIDTDISLISSKKWKSALDKINVFESFIDDANDLLERIDGVLLTRAIDPSLEPSDGDALEELKGPVFRLVFGPPESTQGRFLLSKDGLYYDSQSTGLSLALGEVKEKNKLVNNEDRWRFEHDPNLGGKGVSITSKDLKQYSNTIFDSTIVDNSPFMNDYYYQDNFLRVLTEQRDKRISDIEQQLSELSKSKAGEAIIDNTRQSLISEAALMDDKLNRRKKQIEVAVKAPSIFGDGPKFGRGNIPINDFSYLKDLKITVALSTQRKLVLDQDDVSGVVLPIEPEFVVAPENTEHTSFPEILVPEVGLGEIIYDTSNVSGTEGIAYSITDTVVDDGLIALYNFLDTEVVAPSSTEFVVNNSADVYSKNNCQLVAKDASSVFTKGLGVPYFEGITEHQPSTLVSTQPSALGSYARLPDSRDFRDLMYNRSGFSIDFWTHIPSLLDPEKGWADNGVSSQHRLVLACDNVGLVSGATSQSNILRLNPDFGESVVRGFVMGFTRDNRMVSNTDPSNNFTVNTSSDVSFYVAPTQSRDSSSAGFISSSVGEDCVSTVGWHKWSMNAASAGPNGVKFRNAAKEYVNICLTVDPEKDEVRVYLDSNLMGTSTLTDVFATPSKHPPKLPSFRKYNSFEYSGVSVGASADSYLSGGPLLNTYFTPWIIGGGYTDGNFSGGNFLGGDYGGVRSGLRGHLGGMKFYEKPLTESGVSQNYNAQKSFFKNVRTINTLKGKLFFLLGGENAKGQALLSDIPSASGSLSSQKFDNVYVWNLRSTPERVWDNLEAGHNSVGYDSAWGSQTTFGPELSLASSLSLAYPNENIYIAKMAPSGSFLESSANYGGVTRADWSTTSVQTSADRNLFNLILSSATTTIKGLSVSSEAQPFVKARGNEVFEVCGIFYVNGESDAAVAAAASDYQTNIKDFADGLRSDLSSLDWVNTSAIPFIQTVIHDDTTGAAKSTVRSAQLAVTGTVGMLTNYDLSSLTLQSNSRDLDASSCIVLGDALCNTYLDTL